MRKAVLIAFLLVPSLALAATFNRPLSLGSHGSDVTSLQEILAQQGFLTVQPTGYFGTLTQAAVQTYQKSHNIVSSGSPETTGYGEVGPKTIEALSGIASGITGSAASDKTSLIAALMAQVKLLEAQIAAILSGHISPAASGGTGVTLTRPLGLGAHGADVTELQQFLKDKGYYTYPSVTGYFGPATEEAVQAFQKDHNVVSEGSPETTGYGAVGPQTLALINQLFGGNGGPSSGVTSSQPKVALPSPGGGADSGSGGGGSTASAPATIQNYTPAASGGGGGSSSESSGGGSGSNGGSSGSSADTVAPSITVTAPTANLPSGTTQTTLAVTTDENATCAYSANSSFSFGSGTRFTTTGGTSHSSLIMGLTDGSSNTYYIKCEDQVGNVSGNASVTFAVLSAATTSTTSWTNTSFAAQTGTFTASFDATPNQGDADIVIGLAPAPAAAYSDLAAIVRFNSAGTIDARDGSGYAYGVSIPYSAGQTFHIRMVVSVPSHVYSVYVTPPGGSESLLASNYSFRTEQQSAASLADYASLGSAGTASIQNFGIVAVQPDTTAPSTPAGLTATAVSSTQVNLTWNAASDNVGVTSYTIYRNGTQIGTSATNSYNDLSLSASTAYSYAVSASDAAGNASAQSAAASATTLAAVTSNSCPKGSAYADGCAAAPSGSPQFPSILSSYASRAPWNVAGVDYAVGITPGTVLKDPTTIAVSGVSVNAATHQILVTGSSPITLDGIDFSLDGGWQLIDEEGGTLTVTNSNFGIGSNGQAIFNQVGGAPVVFKYDVFNGNALTDNLNDTIFNLGSGMTLEYSLIENAAADYIDYGYNNIIKYNMFKNDGQLAGTHPDWLQLGGGTYTNQEFEYNTFYQTAATAGPGTQGLQLGGFNTWSLTNATISNNTMIALPGANVNYFVGVDLTNTTGTISVQNNYVDPSGYGFGSTVPFISGGTGTGGTLVSTGNVNMLTGAGIGNTSSSATQTASSCPKGTSYQDGCANAPSGTAPHPTLLSAYAARPSWNVAGVDYYVGVPSNATLTDWQNLNVVGCSVSITSHYVRCDNTSNIVISGVDFSLHGGANLFFVNSPNATVKDSNFGGPNLTTISADVIYADASSPNLTVEYDTIDGAGAGSGSSLVTAGGGGTTVLMYNWLKNYPQHVLETSAIGPSNAITYKYNLIEQGAMQSGAHLNFLQICGSGTDTSIDVEYNTSYQTPEASGGEGYQFLDGCGSGSTIHNVTWSSNTMIASGAATAMSYLIHAGGLQNNGIGRNNYIDPTAAYGTFYPGSVTGWTLTNNIDMNNGKTINVDNTESSGTQTASTCPKGSSYQDGCSAASAGTPQYPNLFSGYTTRPPWNVTGVDYAVGVPTNITLKDPTAGALPSCASYNSSTHVVTITANNCTINGYDFTKAGGIQIYNPSYSGLTIINNKFGASVNTFGDGDLIDDRGPGQTTITYNTFANDPINVPYGDPYGSGTTLVEYNYFYNLGGDALDFGGSSYKTIVKYNAFVQLGMTAGTHPDTVQLCGGTLDPASVMSYNLIYQPSQVVVGGEEGIQVSVQCSKPSITGYSADHNTLIAATGGPAPDGVTMSDVITISALATNVQVLNNYLDARGAYGYFYPTGDISDTCSGNISMTNGSEYSGGVTYTYTPGGPITGTFGNMTCTGSGAPASDTTAPSVPTNLSATAVSTSQINLTWTASTDNVGVTGYNIYRNGTKIGTATTNSFSNTGLTASTNYSYTVSAYDAAGNTSAQSSSVNATTQATQTSSSCPKGSAYADGCAGTPSGTPQLPSLFSGYATRPPWNVAGVDYPVGYPAGATLTDWETLSGPGITVSTTGHYVRVDSTSGVTFNHVDFSLHGGAYLFFVSSPNGKVLNSNFGGTNLQSVGSWIIQADANSPGLTVDNTVMDGAGAGAAAALIGALGGGTVQLHYDWFKNFPQQVIEFGAAATIDYQYNLIEDGGQQPGAHLNYQQLSTGPYTITTQFNTSVQHPEAGGGGEGYQFYNGVGGPITLSSVSFAYNTMLALGSTVSMSYLLHGSGSVATLSSTPAAHDNYFDPTATYAAGNGAVFYPNTFNGWTGSNNINLVTGQQVPNPSEMVGSADAQTPSTPTSLTATAISTSQINLSWTASTDNVGVTGYNIYRNGTKIGTATTNSFSNTGLTASTNYSYTVSAYDAAGNTSAQSSSVNATTQASVVANSCPKGSSYQDGCSGAPPGPAEYPNLLSSFVTRAPWNVAGVDYAVGVPSGTTLADWQSISQTGVTVNTSSNIVTITGNNVTLSGIDFSLHGGAQLVINGVGDTVTKCNFLYGTSMSAQGRFSIVGGSGTNVTITDSTFDGNGSVLGQAAANQSSIIISSFTGTLTLQYNWFKNFNQHVLEYNSNGSNGTVMYQYNLISNGGSGATGQHLNYLQLGTNNGTTNVTLTYNTSYQPTTPVSGGEGYQLGSFGTAAPVVATVASNTVVEGPNGEGRMHINETTQYPSNGGTTASVHDNYFWTNGNAAFYPDPYAGSTDTYTSNIDMGTGLQLSMGSSAPADTTPPVITITAPTGQLAAGTTQTTLSVTTNENATCAWSNTAGTAFASMTQLSTTGGTTHSTTLSGLTNGSSYTTYVKCKDTAGNISTDSSTSYSVAQSTTTTGGTTTSSSCSQATAFLSRVSVDAAHQTDYTNLICGLVADGAWSKLDVFYVFATQNSSAALANLLSSSFTATPAGAPTFAADRGYTLGTSDAINSNYNFASNGTNYTQDSASIGGWSGQAAASWYCTWMTSTQYCGNTNLHALDAGSAVTAFSINGTSQFSVSNAGDGSGLFVLVRPDANTESVYRNGASLGSVSRSSVALENGTFEAGPGINRAMFAGGALSATDISNLYSLLSAYMQSVGAAP